MGPELMNIPREYVIPEGYVNWEVRAQNQVLLDHGAGVARGYGSNTIQDAMKNAMAQAVGSTTFTAANAIDFKVDGAWGFQRGTSIDGGGTGVQNWVRFRADYTASGAETVSLTQLGVASGTSLGTIYSEYDISDVALNDGDTLIVKWTITVS